MVRPKVNATHIPCNINPSYAMDQKKQLHQNNHTEKRETQHNIEGCITIMKTQEKINDKKIPEFIII